MMKGFGVLVIRRSVRERRGWRYLSEEKKSAVFMGDWGLGNEKKGD